MSLMAKRANKPEQPAEPSPDDGPKRYPSRENTRYVGLSVELYELVKKYAADHSDADEEKSISWATKRLIRKALTAEGYIKPPQS